MPENPWLASLVPVKFAIFIMQVRLIGLQARAIAMTSASRDRKTAGKEKTVMPPASKWVTVLSAVVLSSRGGSNGMRLPRTRSMKSKWSAQKRLTRQRNEVQFTQTHRLSISAQLEICCTRWPIKPRQ